MNKNFLCRCMMLAVAGASLTAQAQDHIAAGALSPTLIELQPITIIGNNINGIDSTLPNVDVINLNTLRNPAVNNLKGALAKNPAVKINALGSGNADQLRIRGFGENYAEITLDGQKMPTYYRFGSNVSGARDFVEVETLKQIDIVKGLHSPKQSTGALAGSVNMQTYVPSDFVDREHPFYGAVKAGYTSKDKGKDGTVTLAGAKDNLSGMLIYTRRNYHEPDNMGSDETQTLHDKQDNRQDNILLKGEVELERGNIVATAEYLKRKQKMTPLYPTAHTPKPYPPYESETIRKRFAVEGKFNAVAGLDHADIRASIHGYKQDAGIARGGINHFTQDSVNIQFDGAKLLDLGNTKHNFLFGAGYDHDKFDYTAMSKYGTHRYLPEVTRKTLTAYAKDQMTFSNGFSLSPGIRIEHQRMSSKPDAIYSNSTFFVVQDSYMPHGSSTTVSPSLNASFELGDNAEVFASYAHGVKLADTGNISSVDHPRPEFWIIPNPNLKDEKSDNFELGFNYVSPEKFELKVTGFYHKFKDFIAYDYEGSYGKTSRNEDKEIMRPFNINHAKSYGAELEAGYAISPQLYAHASVAVMKMSGKVDDPASHGITLSQAYPNQAILGLSYNQDERWGADIDWTLAGKGEKLEKETQFRAPGYGVVDVTGWWKPIDNMLITAGVYNLTDKKYWLSADVNGLSTVDYYKQPINLDNYTQPGRNFAVNLRYEF